MPKTIFHTTEKSNFILNMKTGKYHRFNLRILLGYLVLMPIFCIPLEFFKVYSVPGIAFAIVGVAAMVFALIGFMKGVTSKNLFLPAALLAGALVFGIVSVLRAYDAQAAITGADGRSEGWLSLVFYGCIFLLGAQLGKNRLRLFKGLLWLGLAQCAWALVQALPVGLSSGYQNLNALLLFRLFLPSGLTGSPIFLAMLLVMLLFPAMLGAALEENARDRAFYLICSGVFALFAVRTQCLLGLAGTALALLAALCTALVKKGGRRAVVSAAVTAAGICLGVLWSIFAPVWNGAYDRSTGSEVDVPAGFVLYDGGIIWQDSAYRLGSSGYYVYGNCPNPNGTFSIDSIPETYGYQWRVTADLIAQFPLDGAGPDCLVYPQLYQNYDVLSNPNVFDRCYNYYLHLPATLGIPAALCIFALFVCILVRGAGHLKGNGSWLCAGVWGGVLLYMLMLVLGTTSITVTPIFWMLAGMASDTTAD